MKLYTFSTFLFIALLLTRFNAISQTVYTPFIINLAEQDTGEVIRAAEVQENVSVVIINLAPNGDYQISTEFQIIAIPPFKSLTSSSSDGLLHPNFFTESKGPTDPCKELHVQYDTAVTHFLSTENEKDVPVAAGKFTMKVDDLLIKTKCKEEEMLHDIAKDAPLQRSKTERTVSTGRPLRHGEELVVTVVRNDKNKRWVTRFSGGDRGGWRITYGFALPALLAHDEEFSMRAVADSFKITAKENNQITKVIPALFFTWMPKDDELSNYSWSWTGGLGLDITNPIVFAGGSMTFNQNLLLTFGVVAHKVTRLKGKYSVGDILKDNLDDDQLYDQVYRVNPFLALSLRFESNPFSK